MQQCNVIATTTVRPRQQQEQLRKTTIQTTIQLPVVDVDDATAAAAANCVRATFLIPSVVEYTLDRAVEATIYLYDLSY